MVEVLGEEDKIEEDGGIEEEVQFEAEKVGPQISINAICGNSRFQTLRVNGQLRKKTLHMIDSGSTYNFMDEHLAHCLSYALEPITK